MTQNTELHINIDELLNDEKVIEILESKNDLNLAKFLGKKLCGFTKDDEKFIDLLWGSAFNKNWIYASEEIVNIKFGYKQSKDMMTHFHTKLISEFKVDIDYKQVDKTNEFVLGYYAQSKTKRISHNNKRNL